MASVPKAILWSKKDAAAPTITSASQGSGSERQDGSDGWLLTWALKLSADASAHISPSRALVSLLHVAAGEEGIGLFFS